MKLKKQILLFLCISIGFAILLSSVIIAVRMPWGNSADVPPTTTGVTEDDYCPCCGEESHVIRYENGWRISDVNWGWRVGAEYTRDSASVTVPRGVTSIGLPDTVREVHFLDVSTQGLPGGLLQAKNIERVTVAEDNEVWFSRDGVLYRRGTHNILLEYYPIARRNENYTVLPGTTIIRHFENNYIKRLNLPDSVRSISLQFSTENLVELRLPARLRDWVQSAKDFFIETEAKYGLSENVIVEFFD